MKTYVLKVMTATLLIGALYWACQKESDPPAQSVAVPKWEVQQVRQLLYDVEFRGYTKGALAQKRSTTLGINFEGNGTLIAWFGDEVTKHRFQMDSTGALQPLNAGKPYSPILDLLALLPPQGLAEAAVGKNWDVLTPSEARVVANPDVCIVQSRRNFKVLSAGAGAVRMQHSGYLRVVDNTAAERNFTAMFGKTGGDLARLAWTSWRRFQAGETVFSTAKHCLLEASYVAVILPTANMNDAELWASPEREELTIRLRP